MSCGKAEIWPSLEKIKLPLRLQLGSDQTVNVQRDIRTDQWVIFGAVSVAMMLPMPFPEISASPEA
jgi:hypothetical protein